MNKPMEQSAEIVVEEFLPHSPAKVWKALVSPASISRWLMAPSGFAAVEGQKFTFQTTPQGKWDGTIDCRVLAVVPNERLAYSWRGGDEDNAGYGSKLDTVVTFTLSEEGGGTRLRLVHSGFRIPKNSVALQNMGGGWRKIVPQLGNMIGDEAS